MFSSLKDIRLDCGFYFEERQEAVYDVDRVEPVAGDGSTTVFYTKHKPLVDVNDDGTVDEDDVVFYVNGTAVTVSSIDAVQGKITLAVAPANNASLSVDYAWTSVADTMVTTYQTWAYGIIVSVLSKVYVMDVADTDVNALFASSPAESYLANLEVMLAGAKLLQVVYTEENDDFHKQGLAKEKAAMSMISDIANNNVVLLDSDFVELQRTDVHMPVGYPDGSTETDDEDWAFHRTDQL